MSKQYAKGRNAVAECQRSGQKMRYRDLVEDGHIEGLLVHPDWWEPKHPQEIPVTVTDPIALYRPSPEISIPVGHGDPENLDGGTPPTDPLPTNFCTTAAVTVSAGATHVVLDTPTTYIIGQWVFIALDGGGNFVSRITTTADSPSFTVPFTTPFVGTATVGNQVCIGEGFVMPATQTFTVTVAGYNADDEGFTLYGTDQGSVSPSPALVTAEEGLITEFVEITFYTSGTGMEIFCDTTNPNTFTTVPPVSALAQILFTTFSTIEIDHAGGTEILDTTDIGSGGDLNQGASSESQGYTQFWFPNVAKLWGDSDIGLQYDVRFIV